MAPAALYFTQPAISRPWMIVLTVPAHRAQQIALNIAFPLLVIIFILVVVAVIILRLGLRMITGSLQTLAIEAGRIAQGQLNNPMPVDGEDEVGDLRRAFEKMRVGLKARLDELNRLLTVSQGVASSSGNDRRSQARAGSRTLFWCRSLPGGPGARRGSGMGQRLAHPHKF